MSLRYDHENLTMRFHVRTLRINDQVRFPHISIQVFKHMYSISGKFAVQYILGFYQLQMNHDLGKTHHRKSANNKGYLKKKARNKYTRVSYILDSHRISKQVYRWVHFAKYSISKTKTNSEHLFIT